MGSGFPWTVVNHLLQYTVSHPEDRNFNLYPFVGSRFRSWWPDVQKFCRLCMRQYLKTRTMKTHGTLPHISSTVREMWSEETDTWEKIHFLNIGVFCDVTLAAWRPGDGGSSLLRSLGNRTHLHAPEDTVHTHCFRVFYLIKNVFVPHVV